MWTFSLTYTHPPPKRGDHLRHHHARELTKSISPSLPVATRIVCGNIVTYRRSHSLPRTRPRTLPDTNRLGRSSPSAPSAMSSPKWTSRPFSVSTRVELSSEGGHRYLFVVVANQREFRPCGECKIWFSEKICSRCKVQRYCSADCQKKHWGTHKLSCKKSEQD